MKFTFQLPKRYHCKGTYLNYLSVLSFNCLIMFFLQTPKHVASHTRIYIWLIFYIVYTVHCDTNITIKPMKCAFVIMLISQKFF